MARLLAVLCLTALLIGCGAAAPASSPTGGAAGSPVTSASASAADAASPSPEPTDDGAAATPAVSSTPTATSALAPTSAPTSAPTPAPVTTTGRWVKAGGFVNGRMDTQLALLGTGEVLAAGDEATCGVENSGSDSAELWRPGTSRWTGTDRLPSTRTTTTLVALADGRAIVMGGANEDYVAKSSSTVFDPATHQWTVSGLLNTARMSFAAAPLEDGGALVAGGLLIDTNQQGRALGTAETWNPKTGTWTEIAPLASIRQGAVAATLADGRVLVVGGYPKWGAETPLATAEIYDPSAGGWQAAGSLEAPRDGFSLVALRDGGALVVGGNRDEDRAEVFDPATGAWARASGAAPVGERPAAVSLPDGRVLVASGETTQLYVPAADRWDRGPSLPGGMWDASAVGLPDGSVLVGGGWTEPAYPGDTPGCPGYDNRTWRFIPGS